MSTKTIKIPNGQIVGLANWLTDLQLHGSESRIRTRFNMKLVERYKENEKFRLEIVDKYSKKDKDGKNMLSDDKKNVIIDDSKVNEFTKEMEEFLNEEFLLDLHKEDFDVLSKIILNTKYMFGPSENDSEQVKFEKTKQANDYEVWCTIFEKA